MDPYMDKYAGRVYGIHLFLKTIHFSNLFVTANNQTEQKCEAELLLIFSFIGAHKSVSTTKSLTFTLYC